MKENIRCRLRNPEKIYCPVLRAKLKLNSKFLEEMGEFTRFVLYSIGKGYKIEEIVEIVDLGYYIVQEELDYVLKIGLVCRVNDEYELTDLGDRYYKLIDFIDNISQDDLEVHINCFNGLIMEVSEDIVEKKNLNDDIFVLRVKIIDKLYQNKNYSNSKEYVLNKFSNILRDSLDECDIDSIFVNVEYKKEDLYVPYYIKSIADLRKLNELHNSKSDENNVEYDMQLIRDIIRFDLNIRFEKLENYRNVLSTLKNLEIFDEQLISEKSKDLLKLWKYEKNFANSIYFDTATGEVLSNIPESSSNKMLAPIKISRDFNIKDTNVHELKERFKHREWYHEDFFVELKEHSVVNYYENASSLDL